MRLSIYQIDAFTDEVFKGNPACVVPLKEWLPDQTLLNIAQENAVAETAYFIRTKDRFHLRWFTPDIEMDLCGHATLASAFTIIEHLDYQGNEVVFDTLSGELRVTKDDGLLSLNFPSRKPQKAALPNPIRDAISIQPVEVLKARDYVLVYKQEEDVRGIRVDRNTFDQLNLDPGGVIITAPGNESDFVSRFFTPQATILEDPVTGSAHCSLIPYWSEQLGKIHLSAIQLSERQGKLSCQDLGDRVIISGHARTYMQGEIQID